MDLTGLGEPHVFSMAAVQRAVCLVQSTERCATGEHGSVTEGELDFQFDLVTLWDKKYIKVL